MHPELDQLRGEHSRLFALREAHGIAWRSGGPAPTEPAPVSVQPSGLRFQPSPWCRSKGVPAQLCVMVLLELQP